MLLMNDRIKILCSVVLVCCSVLQTEFKMNDLLFHSLTNTLTLFFPYFIFHLRSYVSEHLTQEIYLIFWFQCYHVGLICFFRLLLIPHAHLNTMTEINHVNIMKSYTYRHFINDKFQRNSYSCRRIKKEYQNSIQYME